MLHLLKIPPDGPVEYSFLLLFLVIGNLEIILEILLYETTLYLQSFYYNSKRCYGSYSTHEEGRLPGGIYLFYNNT